ERRELAAGRVPQPRVGRVVGDDHAGVVQGHDLVRLAPDILVAVVDGVAALARAGPGRGAGGAAGGAVRAGGVGAVRRGPGNAGGERDAVLVAPVGGDDLAGVGVD